MHFLSCDIQTGNLLEELPLAVSGSLTKAMATVTTASFDLPVRDPRCPSDWTGLVDPWRVWLVCVDDGGSILWAGIPQNLVAEATSPVVRISAVSPEAYLARRFVPSKKFTQVDQIDIAKWLVERAALYGLPFAYDCPVSGVRRDREYFKDDSATVLKRLEELGNVIGGFEWRIDVRFTADRSAVVPVFVTGYPRIGVASAAPQAVFELPGGLTEVTVETRWDDGDAATFVLAKGSGEGEDTPFSAPGIAEEIEAAGIPRLELVKDFSSVKSLSVLNAHAQALLERYRQGTRVLSLKQRLGAYPRPGIDFDLGDDVRVLCDTDTVRIDEKFRCVGWTVDGNLETLTPLVANFGEESND